jgi:hypothetical protein
MSASLKPEGLLGFATLTPTYIMNVLDSRLRGNDDLK